MRWILPLVLAVVLLAALAWPKPQPAAPSSRSAAPAFTLADLDGTPRSLASFRGHPVLVNFWATWCPPCRAELPELEATWRAHQGCLSVVGVAEDSGSAAEVRAVARKHDLDYPLLIDDGSAASAYGVTTLPRSVLIDGDGRIVRTFFGTVTRERIESAIVTPTC